MNDSVAKNRGGLELTISTTSSGWRSSGSNWSLSFLNAFRYMVQLNFWSITELRKYHIWLQKKLTFTRVWLQSPGTREPPRWAQFVGVQRSPRVPKTCLAGQLLVDSIVKNNLAQEAGIIIQNDNSLKQCCFLCCKSFLTADFLMVV